MLMLMLYSVVLGCNSQCTLNIYFLSYSFVFHNVHHHKFFSFSFCYFNSSVVMVTNNSSINVNHKRLSFLLHTTRHNTREKIQTMCRLWTTLLSLSTRFLYKFFFCFSFPSFFFVIINFHNFRTRRCGRMDKKKHDHRRTTI